MEQTLSRYIWSLRHKNKGKGRKLKSKSRYNDRPCNTMIVNNVIRQQKSNTTRKISGNYVIV